MYRWDTIVTVYYLVLIWQVQFFSAKENKSGVVIRRDGCGSLLQPQSVINSSKDVFTQTGVDHKKQKWQGLGLYWKEKWNCAKTSRQ